MEFGEILQVWQYYAGVVFFGGMLAKLLFRFTPLPDDIAQHLELAKRAGVASELARAAGSESMDLLAKRVGVQEIAAILVSIQKQRRQMLFVGIGIAIVGLILAFMNFPETMFVIPGWIYILAALLGAYWVWQSW